MRRRGMMKRSAGGALQYVGGHSDDFYTTAASMSLTFGGSLTGGIASSVSEGDLVIAAAAHSSANRIHSATGWTKLAQLYANDSVDTILSVFARLVPSGGLSSITVTLSSSITIGAISVMAFRGVDQTTPYGAPFTIETLNTSQANPPSITKDASSFGFFAAAAGVGSGAGPFTNTGATATETPGAASGNSITLMLGYSDTSDTTYDPRQFDINFSFSSYSNASLTMEIKAA